MRPTTMRTPWPRNPAVTTRADVPPYAQAHMLPTAREHTHPNASGDPLATFPSASPEALEESTSRASSVMTCGHDRAIACVQVFASLEGGAQPKGTSDDEARADRGTSPRDRRDDSDRVQ